MTAYIVLNSLVVLVLAINGVIQMRINAAHRRAIETFANAVDAINRVVAIHQQQIDALRGTRRYPS